MNTNLKPDLSGAAARKLTIEGLKDTFQARRRLEASFGHCVVQMDVPLSYQGAFIEYIVSLTGYTIGWGGGSTKVIVCW